MVQAPSVRVLSLDIFDTLLTRPVIDDPRDIFHLVAARVNEELHLDFVALRWHAEKSWGILTPHWTTSMPISSAGTAFPPKRPRA